MKLFSKEKDLIHKIINLVFLIWFVAAVVVCYDAVINLIIGSSTTTSRDMLNQIFTSLGNIIIVGATIYYLNRKKD